MADDKAEWRKKLGIEKYKIYRTSKKQKPYSSDLIDLLSLFNGNRLAADSIVLLSGDRLPLIPISKSPSREQLVEKNQALRKVKDKWEAMKDYWKDQKVPEAVRKEEAARVRKELGMIEGKYRGPVHEEALGQFKKEVSLIEQTFKDFFFNRQVIMQLKAKVGDGTPSEAQKAAYARAKNVVDGCIKRVNKNLQYIHPVISNTSQGLSLGLGAKIPDLMPKKTSSKKYLALRHFDWLHLARVMVNLDPGDVHQCPICDGIFISKQIKKYHPQCKNFRKNRSLEGSPQRAKKRVGERR